MRTSRIGSVVGRQLEAAIFSQLEESAVDTDTEDVEQDSSNETDVTALGPLQSDDDTEVHEMTTAEVHSHQFAKKPQKEDEYHMTHSHMQNGQMCSASLEQSDECHPCHLEEQQQSDSLAVNYENGSLYFESYFELVVPPPPVFVTADWIPVPQRAVLVNFVEQVEVSWIMSGCSSSSPQLSTGMAGSRLSTVTVLSIESHSSRGSSAAFMNDADERLSWARDAQVIQDSSNDSARLNHAAGRLTDSGFMSNPSTPVSPLIAGVTNDASRQWVSDGMTRTDSDLTASTITSSAASAATTDWSKSDDLKVDNNEMRLKDLSALNSVGDIAWQLPSVGQLGSAGMQPMKMDEQHDGDGYSEGSSMV